jgi:hypothetical protein
MHAWPHFHVVNHSLMTLMFRVHAHNRLKDTHACDCDLDQSQKNIFVYKKSVYLFIYLLAFPGPGIF